MENFERRAERANEIMVDLLANRRELYERMSKSASVTSEELAKVDAELILRVRDEYPGNPGFTLEPDQVMHRAILVRNVDIRNDPYTGEREWVPQYDRVEASIHKKTLGMKFMGTVYEEGKDLFLLPQKDEEGEVVYAPYTVGRLVPDKK